MRSILGTLEELAPIFGLPALAPNPQGIVSLQLGESDILSMEFLEQEGGHAVVLCFSRLLPPYHEGVFERALTLCNAQALPFPVRVGLAEQGRLRSANLPDDRNGADRLVLMVRFSEYDFRVPQVLQGIEVLQNLHRQLTTMN